MCLLRLMYLVIHPEEFVSGSLIGIFIGLLVFGAILSLILNPTQHTSTEKNPVEVEKSMGNNEKIQSDQEINIVKGELQTKEKETSQGEINPDREPFIDRIFDIMPRSATFWQLYKQYGFKNPWVIIWFLVVICGILSSAFRIFNKPNQ